MNFMNFQNHCSLNYNWYETFTETADSVDDSTSTTKEEK